MEPNVPPDLLRVIDAVRADEQLAVILVLGEPFERVGNAGPREAFEYFQSIAFEARIAPDPEWRIAGERIDVRQEIARLVHDVDRHFAIRNSDMDVQPEDEIGPRHLLHVF